MSLNGAETNLLVRMLAASELRAKVISSNIANQNTPGYKRRVVSFEEKLRQALESPRPARLDAILPEVSIDEQTPARADGNNVALELELNALRENRLLYETYATMLEAHFNLMDQAVTGGR